MQLPLLALWPATAATGDHCTVSESDDLNGPQWEKSFSRFKTGLKLLPGGDQFLTCQMMAHCSSKGDQMVGILWLFMSLNRFLFSFFFFKLWDNTQKRTENEMDGKMTAPGNFHPEGAVNLLTSHIVFLPVVLLPSHPRGNQHLDFYLLVLTPVCASFNQTVYFYR